MKTIYQLTILGKCMPYSSLELAAKSGAEFIARNLLKMCNHVNSSHQFTDAYCQERYLDCIEIWNQYIDNFYPCTPYITRKALLKEVNMDTKFDYSVWG